MSVQKLSIQLQASMTNNLGKILYVNFAFQSQTIAVQYQMKKTIESHHINVNLQKYSSEVWSWSVNTLIRINLGRSEHSIRQWIQRKVVCVHVMKAYGESGSTTPHFPKLDTR